MGRLAQEPEQGAHPRAARLPGLRARSAVMPSSHLGPQGTPVALFKGYAVFLLNATIIGKCLRTKDVQALPMDCGGNASRPQFRKWMLLCT